MFHQLTLEEVNEAFGLVIKCNKAGEKNGIVPEMFRYVGCALSCRNLCALFQEVWYREEVPQEWKDALSHTQDQSYEKP